MGVVYIGRTVGSESQITNNILKYLKIDYKIIYILYAILILFLMA